MNITLTKSRLVELLKDALARAEKEDARVKKAHEKDEQAALTTFRANVRDAAHWDYARLKKEGFRVELSYKRQPTCPRSNVPEIKRILKCVELDMRKSETFHITKGSDVELAMNWVPKHERPAESVCAD